MSDPVLFFVVGIFKEEQNVGQNFPFEQFCPIFRKSGIKNEEQPQLLPIFAAGDSRLRRRPLLIYLRNERHILGLLLIDIYFGTKTDIYPRNKPTFTQEISLIYPVTQGFLSASKKLIGTARLPRPEPREISGLALPW